MVDISFTATAIKAGANAILAHGKAGEAVVRGNAVYLDGSDNEYKLADATDAAKDAAVGFVMNDAADGQEVTVQTGGNLTCDGLSLSVGVNLLPVYVLSVTGNIAPLDDLAASDYITVMGAATSTTNLRMAASGPVVTGVQAT